MSVFVCVCVCGSACLHVCMSEFFLEPMLLVSRSRACMRVYVAVHARALHFRASVPGSRAAKLGGPLDAELFL